MKFEKLNLIGIPNYCCKYKNERFKLAKEQEKFVVEILNHTYPSRLWMQTHEWAGDTNTEYDRTLGDILCIDRSTCKALGFIDLKVQQFGMNEPWNFGTVMLNSYFGFAYNKKHHFYLMVNEDGSDFIFIDASSISKLIENKTKFICKTKFDRHPYQHNIYDWIKDFYCVETNDVAPEDFIPTRFVKQFNLK